MRISIFDNQHEAVKELPEERQGAFWVALFAYVFDGVEPTFSEPMERMAWSLVRTYIDKSKTAVQNGEKGGRKPSAKTKAETKRKNQGKKPSTETKHGNQPLLENENEREGLGESLKDSLTPSHAQGAAVGEDTAAPSAEVDWGFDRTYHSDPRLMTAAEQAALMREDAERMRSEAAPCPAEVLERVKAVAS